MIRIIRRLTSKLPHSLQKFLNHPFSLSLNFASFKKCVAVTVTACFLFNIAGVSALAYDDNEYKKIKKENDRISVWNTTNRMHSVSSSMKPLKVGANNTVSRDGKILGTIDPKTGEISTMQQGKDGGQTSLKPDKLLTDEYRKQKTKETKESTRGDSRKSEDTRPTSRENRESNNSNQREGYQSQKSVQSQSVPSSETSGKNKKDAQASQNRNAVVNKNEHVHELNSNTKLESQMVNGGKKLDESDVSVVNMAKVQELAAKEGVALVAKEVKVNDVEKALKKGTMVAHLKNKAGGADIFVSVAKDGTVKYAGSDGKLVVTSLSSLKKNRKFEWTGKVLQTRTSKEAETLSVAEKNSTKGTFSLEVLAGEKATEKTSTQTTRPVTEQTAQTTKTTQTSQTKKTTQKTQTTTTSAQTTETTQTDSEQAVSTLTGWLDEYSNADAATQATMAAKMAATLGISTDQLATLSTETAQKISSYLSEQGDNVINCAVEALSSLFTSAGKTLNKATTAVSAIMTDILSGNLSTSSEQMQLSMFAIQKTAEQNGMSLTGYSTNMSGLQQAVSDSKGAIVQLNTSNGLGHFVTVTGIQDGNVTYQDADGQSKTVSSSEFSSQWSGKVLSQNKIDGASVLSESKLKSTKGAAGSETEATSAAVTTANNKVSAADAKLTTANAKAAAADSKVQAANTKVQTADAKVQAANTKVQAADAKVQTANAKVEAANTKVQTANAKVEAANTKVQTANTKVQAANDKLQAANTKVQTANAKVDAANAKVDAANTKLQNANTKLQAANTKVDAANAKVDAANTKLQNANTKLQAANTKLDAANTKLQAANTKVTNANNKVNAANAANQAAQAALKNAQAKTQAAQTKLNQALTTQQQKAQAAAAAAQKVQQAQTKVSSAQQAVQSAQQKVSTAQGNLASKTQALASAVANVASARSSLASAHSAVVSAQSAVASARARLASAKTPEEKAAAQAALNAALAQLAAAKAAEEAARRALEAALEAQRRAEEEKRQAEQELQQAQQELQQKEQELQQAQQELTQAQAEKTKADAEKSTADTAVTQAQNELTTAQNEENTAKQNADKTAQELQQAQQEQQQAQQEQQQAQQEQQQAQQEQQQAQQEQQQAQQEQQQAQQEQQQAQQEQQQAQQEQQQAQQEQQQAQQEQQQAQQEQQQAQQELLQAQQEQQQAQQELQQAQQELQQAQQELQQAQQEKQQAEQEKQQAEQEKQQAEQEKQQAEQEKQQAEQEKLTAEQEKKTAEAEKTTAESAAKKAQEEAAKKLVDDAASSSDWLKSQYKSLLGRDIDASGEKEYSNLLASAGTDSDALAKKKEAIVNSIKNSEEYKSRTLQQSITKVADDTKTTNSATTSNTTSSQDNSSWLKQQYKNLLGRDVDASGEKEYSNLLASVGNDSDALTKKKEAIVNSIKNSEEYKKKQGTTTTTTSSAQKTTTATTGDSKASSYEITTNIDFGTWSATTLDKDTLNAEKTKYQTEYSALSSKASDLDWQIDQDKNNLEDNAATMSQAEKDALQAKITAQEEALSNAHTKIALAQQDLEAIDNAKDYNPNSWSPIGESSSDSSLRKLASSKTTEDTTKTDNTSTKTDSELTGSEKLAKLNSGSSSGEVAIVRTESDGSTTRITGNSVTNTKTDGTVTTTKNNGNVSSAAADTKSDSKKTTNLSAQQQKKWDAATSANTTKSATTSDSASQKTQTTTNSPSATGWTSGFKSAVDTSKVTTNNTTTDLTSVVPGSKAKATAKNNTATATNTNNETLYDKTVKTFTNIGQSVNNRIKKIAGSGTASATAVTPVKDTRAATNASSSDSSSRKSSGSDFTGTKIWNSLKTTVTSAPEKIEKAIVNSYQQLTGEGTKDNIAASKTSVKKTVSSLPTIVQKVVSSTGKTVDSVKEDASKALETTGIYSNKIYYATTGSQTTAADKAAAASGLGGSKIEQRRYLGGVLTTTRVTTPNGGYGKAFTWGGSDVALAKEVVQGGTITEEYTVNTQRSSTGETTITIKNKSGAQLTANYGKDAQYANSYQGVTLNSDGTQQRYSKSVDGNTANYSSLKVKTTGNDPYRPTSVTVVDNKSEQGKVDNTTGDIIKSESINKGSSMTDMKFDSNNNVTNVTWKNYSTTVIKDSNVPGTEGQTTTKNGTVEMKYNDNDKIDHEAYNGVNVTTVDKNNNALSSVTLGSKTNPYTRDYTYPDVVLTKNAGETTGTIDRSIKGGQTVSVTINGDVTDNLASKKTDLTNKTVTKLNGATEITSTDSKGRVVYQETNTNNYETYYTDKKTGQKVILASGRDVKSTGNSYLDASGKDTGSTNPTSINTTSEQYSYMDGKNSDPSYTKTDTVKTDITYSTDNNPTGMTVEERVQRNALSIDANDEVKIGKLTASTESSVKMSNMKETVNADGTKTSSYDYTDAYQISYLDAKGAKSPSMTYVANGLKSETVDPVTGRTVSTSDKAGLTESWTLNADMVTAGKNGVWTIKANNTSATVTADKVELLENNRPKNATVGSGDSNTLFVKLEQKTLSSTENTKDYEYDAYNRLIGNTFVRTYETADNPGVTNTVEGYTTTSYGYQGATAYTFDGTQTKATDGNAAIEQTGATKTVVTKFNGKSVSESSVSPDYVVAYNNGLQNPIRLDMGIIDGISASAKSDSSLTTAVAQKEDRDKAIVVGSAAAVTAGVLTVATMGAGVPLAVALLGGTAMAALNGYTTYTGSYQALQDYRAGDTKGALLNTGLAALGFLPLAGAGLKAVGIVGKVGVGTVDAAKVGTAVDGAGDVSGIVKGAKGLGTLGKASTGLRTYASSLPGAEKVLNGISSTSTDIKAIFSSAKTMGTGGIQVLRGAAADLPGAGTVAKVLSTSEAGTALKYVKAGASAAKTITKTALNPFDTSIGKLGAGAVEKVLPSGEQLSVKAMSTSEYASYVLKNTVSNSAKAAAEVGLPMVKNAVVYGNYIPGTPQWQGIATMVTDKVASMSDNEYVKKLANLSENETYQALVNLAVMAPLMVTGLSGAKAVEGKYLSGSVKDWITNGSGKNAAEGILNGAVEYATNPGTFIRNLGNTVAKEVSAISGRETVANLLTDALPNSVKVVGGMTAFNTATSTSLGIVNTLVSGDVRAQREGLRDIKSADGSVTFAGLVDKYKKIAKEYKDETGQDLAMAGQLDELQAMINNPDMSYEETEAAVKEFMAQEQAFRTRNNLGTFGVTGEGYLTDAMLQDDVFALDLSNTYNSAMQTYGTYDSYGAGSVSIFSAPIYDSLSDAIVKQSNSTIATASDKNVWLFSAAVAAVAPLVSPLVKNMPGVKQLSAYDGVIPLKGMAGRLQAFAWEEGVQELPLQTVGTSLFGNSQQGQMASEVLQEMGDRTPDAKVTRSYAQSSVVGSLGGSNGVSYTDINALYTGSSKSRQNAIVSINSAIGITEQASSDDTDTSVRHSADKVVANVAVSHAVNSGVMGSADSTQREVTATAIADELSSPAMSKLSPVQKLEYASGAAMMQSAGSGKSTTTGSKNQIDVAGSDVDVNAVLSKSNGMDVVTDYIIGAVPVAAVSNDKTLTENVNTAIDAVAEKVKSSPSAENAKVLAGIGALVAGSKLSSSVKDRLVQKTVAALSDVINNLDLNTSTDENATKEQKASYDKIMDLMPSMEGLAQAITNGKGNGTQLLLLADAVTSNPQFAQAAQMWWLSETSNALNKGDGPAESYLRGITGVSAQYSENKIKDTIKLANKSETGVKNTLLNFAATAIINKQLAGLNVDASVVTDLKTAVENTVTAGNLDVSEQGLLLDTIAKLNHVSSTDGLTQNAITAYTTKNSTAYARYQDRVSDEYGSVVAVSKDLKDLIETAENEFIAKGKTDAAAEAASAKVMKAIETKVNTWKNPENDASITKFKFNDKQREAFQEIFKNMMTEKDQMRYTHVLQTGGGKTYLAVLSTIMLKARQETTGQDAEQGETQAVDSQKFITVFSNTVDNVANLNRHFAGILGGALGNVVTISQEDVDAARDNPDKLSKKLKNAAVVITTYDTWSGVIASDWSNLLSKTETAGQYNRQLLENNAGIKVSEDASGRATIADPTQARRAMQILLANNAPGLDKTSIPYGKIGDAVADEIDHFSTIPMQALAVSQGKYYSADRIADYYNELQSLEGKITASDVQSLTEKYREVGIDQARITRDAQNLAADNDYAVKMSGVYLQMREAVKAAQGNLQASAFTSQFGAQLVSAGISTEQTLKDLAQFNENYKAEEYFHAVAAATAGIAAETKDKKGSININGNTEYVSENWSLGSLFKDGLFNSVKVNESAEVKKLQDSVSEEQEGAEAKTKALIDEKVVELQKEYGNLFSEQQIREHVRNGVGAQQLTENKEYYVKDGKVVVTSSGRGIENLSLPAGMMQVLEAQNNVAISKPNQETYVSNSVFAMDVFNNIVGLTGTVSNATQGSVLNPMNFVKGGKALGIESHAKLFQTEKGMMDFIYKADQAMNDMGIATFNLVLTPDSSITKKAYKELISMGAKEEDIKSVDADSTNTELEDLADEVKAGKYKYVIGDANLIGRGWDAGKMISAASVLKEKQGATVNKVQATNWMLNSNDMTETQMLQGAGRIDPFGDNRFSTEAYTKDVVTLYSVENVRNSKTLSDAAATNGGWSIDVVRNNLQKVQLENEKQALAQAGQNVLLTPQEQFVKEQEKQNASAPSAETAKKQLLDNGLSEDTANAQLKELGVNEGQEKLTDQQWFKLDRTTKYGALTRLVAPDDPTKKVLSASDIEAIETPAGMLSQVLGGVNKASLSDTGRTMYDKIESLHDTLDQVNGSIESVKRAQMKLTEQQRSEIQGIQNKLKTSGSTLEKVLANFEIAGKYPELYSSNTRLNKQIQSVEKQTGAIGTEIISEAVNSGTYSDSTLLSAALFSGIQVKDGQVTFDDEKVNSYYSEDTRTALKNLAASKIISGDDKNWDAVSFNDIMSAVKSKNLTGLVTKLESGKIGNVIRAELKVMPTIAISAGILGVAALAGLPVSAATAAIGVGSLLVSPAITTLTFGESSSGTLSLINAPIKTLNEFVDNRLGSEAYRAASVLKNAAAAATGKEMVAQAPKSNGQKNNTIMKQLQTMMGTSAVENYQFKVSEVLDLAKENGLDEKTALTVAGIGLTDITADTALSRYETLKARYTGALAPVAKDITVQKIASSDLGFDSGNVQVTRNSAVESKGIKTAAADFLSQDVTVDWTKSDIDYVDSSEVYDRGRMTGTLSLSNGGKVAVTQKENFVILADASHSAAYDFAGKKITTLNDNTVESGTIRQLVAAEEAAASAAKATENKGIQETIAKYSVISVDEESAMILANDAIETSVSAQKTAKTTSVTASDRIEKTLGRRSADSTYTESATKSVQNYIGKVIDNIEKLATDGIAYQTDTLATGSMLNNVVSVKTVVNGKSAEKIETATDAIMSKKSSPEVAKIQSLTLLHDAVAGLHVNTAVKQTLTTQVEQALSKVTLTQINVNTSKDGSGLAADKQTTLGSKLSSAIDSLNETFKKYTGVKTAGETDIDVLMTGKKMSSETFFGISGPARLSDVLPVVLSKYQDKEGLLKSVNVTNQNAGVGEIMEGYFAEYDAIKAATQQGLINDGHVRLTQITIARDVLLDSNALNKYEAVGKKVAMGKEVNVATDSDYRALEDTLAGDGKTRVSDKVLLGWAENRKSIKTAQNGQAMTVEAVPPLSDKMIDVETIDVASLQNAINKRTSETRLGVIGSVLRFAGISKKTSSEVALEKELKDILGSEGMGYDGSVIRKSTGDVLNPLGAKAFTQSA